MDNKTLHALNTILRRDSKDTTYKFALLRALIEISTEADQHLVRETEDQVVFPLGLIIEKWLLYYYPLIEKELPQKHGEDPQDESTKGISFRRSFKEITKAYSEQRGGFPAFYNDFRRGILAEQTTKDLIRLLGELRFTITRYPMKHLGVSFYKDHYSLVSFNKDSARLCSAKLKETIDPEFLIKNFGTFSLRRDFYELFRFLGGFITGTDAIMYQWAEWTANAKKEKGISVNQALQVLMTSPQTERNVQDARRVYDRLLSGRGYLRCVWTNRYVRANDLEIDHAIPFSLWANNDLWNLLPAHRYTNSNKRDRVPSPKLVQARASQIQGYWDKLRTVYTDLFDREFRVSLVGLEDLGNNWPGLGITALADRCHYLIEERGFETWRPSQST